MMSNYRLWGGVGLAILLVWLIWLLHPLGTGTDRIIGVEDTYLHTWNLWWAYYALAVEGTNPYFTRLGGHPRGVHLTYHSLILPLGTASIPLFSLGFSAFQVYLTWLYVVPVAGYLSMFFLLRRLRAPPLACAAAGLFLVARPSFWGALPRPDRYCYVLIPAVLLAVLAVRDRGPAWLLLPGFLGASIVLMSPYYGVGLLLLWLLGFGIRERLGLRFERYVWLGPLVLLFSSFEWVPRLVGTVPDYRTSFGFLAPPESYLLPPARLFWVSSLEAWTGLTLSMGGAGFLGFTALVLAGWVAWTRWGPRVRWVLGAVFVFWLVMVSPPLLVAGARFLEESTALPAMGQLADLFRIVRSPQRLMVFPILLVGIGLGSYRGWSRWWGVALLLLIVLEQVPVPVDKKLHELAPAEAFETVRRRAGEGPLVQIPLERKGGEPALAQTVHHRKLALSPLTYVPPRLERTLESNPVLRALYHRRVPPDRGWEQLRVMGYEGFLLHRWPRGPNRRGHTPLPPRATARWDSLRPIWRATLRERLGPPAVSNRYVELYRFPGNDPASGKESGPSPGLRGRIDTRPEG